MNLLQKIWKPSLNKAVFLSLIFGIFFGKYIKINIHDILILKNIIQYLNLISDIFIRALKIFIAPMVFCILIDSISSVNHYKKFGSLFFKTMIGFTITGLFALILGVVMEHVLKTGFTLQKALQKNILAIPDKTDICNSCNISLKGILNNLIPDTIISGFINNNTLQVILIAILLGVAAISVDGADSLGFFTFIRSVSKILSKITSYILMLVPFAVFASVSSAVISNGFEVASAYFMYLIHFLIALSVLVLIILGVGICFLGKDLILFLGRIWYLIVISFSASSSQIVLPGVMAELSNIGVRKPLSAFITPLGFLFNQLAGMMNCTFATLFIIHLYGFTTTFSQEIFIICLLFVTSKAMIGIPRASSVIIAAALSSLGYPESGILILFPIDGFLDMIRSSINVFGNVATVMVMDKLIEVPHE